MQLNTVLIDRQLVQYHTWRSRSPKAWREFEHRLALSWLYHDQAMEGIALTEEEIARALRREPGRHYSDGVLLERIQLTFSAIQTLMGRATTGRRPMELEELKSYHAMLLPEGDPSAGRYRKEETPPPHYSHEVTRPPSISYRLRRLVEAIGGEYAGQHPLRAAAAMHQDFMAIWPFDERSGTAGRLLMNDWLLRSGYPPAIIHAIDRQEYFDALGGSSDRMLAVVLEGVETTLRAAEATLGSARRANPPGTRALVA